MLDRQFFLLHGDDNEKQVLTKEIYAHFCLHDNQGKSVMNNYGVNLIILVNFKIVAFWNGHFVDSNGKEENK